MLFGISVLDITLSPTNQMYESLEFFLYLGLAIPAILIDRSAACSGPAKTVWWCLSAASGIAGLMLPYGLGLIAPNVNVPLRADRLFAFALPWIVYVLFRTRFARSAAAAGGAEQPPTVHQSQAEKVSEIAQHKTNVVLVNMITALRTGVIVFCGLVAGYLVLVVGIMACCSH